MRSTMLSVGLLILPGCYNERTVSTPLDVDQQAGEFVNVFEEETRQNDLAPAIVNEPVVTTRGGARTGAAVPASGPIVVAATGPTTRPIDPYTVDYNPASVISIRGPIVGFRRIPLSHDRTGLFIEVHVGGEIVEVYLGPEAWLIDQGLATEITNRIAITGSRLQTTSGRTIIIARDAMLGDGRVAIRNESGAPLFPVPADADEDGVD